MDGHSGHGRTGYGQAKDSERVFKVRYQTRGDISTQDHNSSRFPDSLGNRRHALQIQNVVKCAQVLEFLVQGCLQ